MLELKGKLGKIISVDENFVEFKQKSLFTGTNERKMPISKISSVEVKKPGFMAGYIQIAEVGASKNKGISTGAMQAAEDENSVLFNGQDEYEIALQIKEFIENQMVKLSSNTVVTQQTSSADEISKFKNLLDQGIINQEEFDAKKKQLLGL